MLTVYESPCQKGMINKTYHKEMKDVAHFTKEYRQMEYHMRVEGSGKRHVDKDPIKRDKQTTHHKKTEMLNESHQGDVIGIYNEDPRETSSSWS